MDLYLRKVIHPQAHDNYRVILKSEEGEFEIGSIGIQHSAGAVYFWAVQGRVGALCRRRANLDRIPEHEAEAALED